MAVQTAQRMKFPKFLKNFKKIRIFIDQTTIYGVAQSEGMGSRLVFYVW